MSTLAPGGGHRRRLINPGGLGSGVERELVEVGEHVGAVGGQRRRANGRGARRHARRGGDRGATSRRIGVQPVVAARDRISGHLANRELVLEGLKLIPLSRCQAQGAGHGYDDALVVGDLGAVAAVDESAGSGTLPGLVEFVTTEV